MAISVEGKILLDTNVFVDYLREGLHDKWVLGGAGRAVRFLSSVVLFELRFGADTPPRARAVDAIKRAFPANRLVAPTGEIFDRAAIVLRALHGDAARMKDRLGVTNDILIALTARAIGATVVTSNIREFQRIAEQVRGLSVRAPLAEAAPAR